MEKGINLIDYARASQMVHKWVQNKGDVDDISEFEPSYQTLKAEIQELGINPEQVIKGYIQNLKTSDEEKEVLTDILLNGSESSFAFYQEDPFKPKDKPCKYALQDEKGSLYLNGDSLDARLD